MENQTRWVASWEDGAGRQRVYIFRGSPSRMQARIELTLKIFDLHEPLPEGYGFEAIEAGIPNTTPTRSQTYCERLRVKVSKGIPKRLRLVHFSSAAGVGGFSSSRAEQ